MKTSHKFQLGGWFLFLVCAVLYLISGINTDDPCNLTGSIMFLIGCIFFLIPLIQEVIQDRKHH